MATDVLEVLRATVAAQRVVGPGQHQVAAGEPGALRQRALRRSGRGALVPARLGHRRTIADIRVLRSTGSSSANWWRGVVAVPV